MLAIKSEENEYQKNLNENIKFFEKNRKLSDALKELEVNIVKCSNRANIINEFSSDYDFEAVQYNGYRSICTMLDSAVDRIDKQLTSLVRERTKWFFKAKYFISAFDEWNEILVYMQACFDVLIAIHEENNGSNSLFAKPATLGDILDFHRNLNSVLFLGQHSGFFYTPCISEFVRPVLSTFASLYKFQESSSATIFKFVKYFSHFIGNMRNPNERARNSYVALDKGDITLFKRFWEFNELPFNQMIANFFGRKLAINETFKIATQALVTSRNDAREDKFNVPVPMSCLGVQDITFRLMSSKTRRGMLKRDHPVCAEMSKVLIYHVHGGGFVSQTSATHEVYLKEMCHELDVPIVIVDYSLCMFPRALEEIFYSYCYLIEHPEEFGWTGEKLIVMGDSAGSNLMISCNTKCIEANIRQPDIFYSFYGFFYLDFCLSPSRIFSIMDPFLPPKVVCNILKSYLTGEPAIKDSVDNFKEKREGNYLASPYLTSHEILKNFPKVVLYATNYDAGLDDNVEMAKKLQKSGVKVELKIIPNLPHAFLNYVHISPKCREAFDGVTKDIKEYIDSQK